MDQDLSGSDLQTIQDADNDQSLVGKLKKNVSEIISNTSLSKWFRKTSPTSAVRRRQDDSDDDEDLQELQPPTKRTKLPVTKEVLSLDVSSALSPISSVNNTNKALYRRFPEPVAGPSGYQTRKLINSTSLLSERSDQVPRQLTAQGKEATLKSAIGLTDRRNKELQSDSEESTSGYSSGRVGSKELVSQEGSKQASPSEASPRRSRSLFENSHASRLLAPDGPVSSPRNSSLSSRMPSFNPSMFGASSFADRTLSSKKLLSSPFYNGRTIYGGASAYGRNTKRCPQDIQKTLRQSVSIKPANTGASGRNMQLSKTARRILDTLEKYSSPVTDAKQIPVAAKKGSLTNFIGANPYRIRESRGASNKELQVPSVTDLLKLKMEQQKSRLQNTTESVRQIATKSDSALSTEAYQIPVQKENEKHISKMKTKITSVRQKVQVDETVPEVNLKPISLPIDKLPTFDFVVPPPVRQPSLSPLAVKEPATSPIKASKEDSSKKLIQVSHENGKITGAFKFSSPIVLADCLKPLKTMNHFKFSEPLVKKRRSIHAELDDHESNKTNNKKNNGENVPDITNGGSVWDKFRPKNNTWECTVCMIRNQFDAVKCVACETPNSQKKLATEAIVPLKVVDITWECPTCLIRNKTDLQKCLACGEKKPGNSSSAGDSDVREAKSSGALLQTTATPKPSPQTLSNTSVFAKNPSTTSSTSTKTEEIAATFGTDFKKKEDEWECQVCMVRNKSDASKCQCCESANPSVPASAEPNNAKSAISTFNFGIDKNTATSFTFGIPPDAKASIPKTNAAVIFGDKREEPKVEQNFTFGIPAKDTDEKQESKAADDTSKAKPTFSFGLKPTESADSEKPPVFTFGSETKKSDAIEAKPATPALSFGAAKAGEEEPSQKLTSFGASAKTATAPTFSFGATTKTEQKVGEKADEARVNPLLKPTEKLPDKTVVAAPGFTFGLTKVSTPVSSAPSAVALNVSSEKLQNKRTRPEEAESAPLAKSSIFTFKSPTTNGDVGKSLFGKPAEDKAAGGFSFNFASNASPASSAAVAPTFASTVSQAEIAKPVFKFGAAETAKQPNGFSFGSTKQAESKPFAFGQAAAPSFAPTPPKQGQFSFGSSTETKPDSFSIPSFDLPSVESKTAVPFASGFGVTAPNSKPSFSFGATTAPTFGFGSSQKTEPTFGAAAATPTSLFGAVGNQPQPTFGAAAAQSNGSFNFGSAAAGSQKAGFTFGASAASSVSGAPSSGFNFGSSALGGTAPTGGFNFANPTPSFDANAKPSFNFTGGAGLAAFLATPSQDGAAMPPRKMKRAVRRTVR